MGQSCSVENMPYYTHGHCIEVPEGGRARSKNNTSLQE